MDAKNQRPEFEDIDRWLNFALRERASAEPRSGLEERVLARLAAEPQPRAAWWPVMAAATAVLVIAATLATMHLGSRERIIANAQPHPTVLHETPAQANSATPDKGPASTQPRITTGGDAACCVSARMPAITRSREAARSSLKSRPAVDPEGEQLPKLATFPAPRPETAEERMLARVAARRGSFDVANVSPDLLPLKDLSVPEFKIHPMEEPPPEDTPQE